MLEQHANAVGLAVQYARRVRVLWSEAVKGTLKKKKKIWNAAMMFFTLPYLAERCKETNKLIM